MAAAAAPTDPARRIAAMRRFTRFYTRQIGLLNEHLYDSPFSLTEVRVLYELAHRPSTTAAELARDLALDAGYLSRILRRFEAQGLVVKTASPRDARQSLLAISARGRKAFAPLETRSGRQVGALLDRISPAEQERLVSAMETIQAILEPRKDSSPTILLRSHRPGRPRAATARRAVRRAGRADPRRAATLVGWPLGATTCYLPARHS